MQRMQSFLRHVLCFFVSSLLAGVAFAQTRQLTTVAGTGVAGYAGDAGPATSARLNNPDDVALAGNVLYIADRNNHRVRRVDGSGVINTVAGSGLAGWFFSGGPALFASLDR